MPNEIQDALLEIFSNALSNDEAKSNDTAEGAIADLMNEAIAPGQLEVDGSPGTAQTSGAVDSEPLANAVAQLADSIHQTAANTANGFFGGLNPASEADVGQSYYGISASSGSRVTGGGAGSALETTASAIFGSGLGLASLIGGLFGLFNGGDSAPEPLERYEMPAPIAFEAAVSGGGLTDSDYNQMGLPRLYGDITSSNALGGSAPATASDASGGGAPANPTPAQINISVQAIDARSFMDYSGEIAKAVRDAMLNLSSINDVVSEL
jgi:hypothetical protein